MAISKTVGSSPKSTLEHQEQPTFHFRVTPSHHQVVLDMGITWMALKMISRVSG
jgi:hypothetical protein